MRLTIENKRISWLFFILGMVLKQLYLSESGTMQIGDYCFLASFISAVIGREIHFSDIDKPIYIFSALAILVNSLYHIYYGEAFVNSSMYLIYNMIIITLMRSLLVDIEFAKRMLWATKVNILLQLIVFVLGRGQYYGGSRYGGTFNDPNQYAFFILSNMFMMYLLSQLLGNKIKAYWYILTAISIIVSISSGMILSYALFLLFVIIVPSLSNKSKTFVVFAISVYCISVCFLLTNGMTLLTSIARLINWRPINSVLARFVEKSKKLSGQSGISGFLLDREMKRIFIEPIYFLYGCGEGLHSRFIPISNESGEIHCTILALWYYYGIVPYSFFIKWIKNSLKGINIKILGVYFATIIEAFTLANHRQPFFWAIFVLGSVSSYYMQQNTGVTELENE